MTDNPENIDCTASQNINPCTAGVVAEGVAESAEYAALQASLQGLLPGAQLSLTSLPLVPEVSLWLLRDSYPQHALDAETASVLMDSPPYWSFCWASGQVLARYLLDYPEQVAQRTVLDLGPGSGVVAIAAALAGAKRVIACDVDSQALQACSLNAQQNGVSIETCSDLSTCLADADLVTAADILYDRDNMPLLARLRLAANVLLADSRVRDLQPPGYYHFSTVQASTWPDLDESREFNQVRLFSTESVP